MKKRTFVNEKALSIWDQMTNEESNLVKGGKSAIMPNDLDSNQDGDDTISVTWSKSVKW